VTFRRVQMRIFAAVFRVTLINFIVEHLEIRIKMLGLSEYSLDYENFARHLGICSV
jgi:hypothetical protein